MIRRMSERERSLLKIHAAVLLFGMIGPFGKLIALPSVLIVAGRVAVAAAALLPVIVARKERLWPDRRRIRPLWVVLGAVMALHWIAFFQCVKMAGVAVAVLTFATAPVFVGFLEPWFFRERFSARNIALSFVCVAGVALLLPRFDMRSVQTIGVLWGLASGFGFAVLSLMYRHAVIRTSPLVLMFWQCAAASVLLAPAWLLAPFTGGGRDIAMIVVLGLVFTALAHGLYVSGMKGVSAHTATVIVTLEPLYAILLAWLLLGEGVGVKTVAGGALILASAFLAAGNRRTAFEAG
jgi:drug/metabolite transporter (DMT)-like permease